ncbi:MAG: hypothetical protein NC918_00235 [Candidatus Omnitrophica bacterium]|nr:hypothetical protein [Candidatus Omnitrophota bacterium]
MKLKLTPSFAYLAGLIKFVNLKTRAIAIKGDNFLIEIFLKHLIENDLVKPNRIIVRKNLAFTYHLAYKNFLKKIIEEEVDRFKHHNEYSASFLAGLFDYSGEVNQNYIILKKWDEKDKMVLENLGFFIEKKSDWLIIYNKDMFTKFIKNYSKKISI